MSNGYDLIETVARVAQKQPTVDPVTISKALVKLRKLSHTLQSRYDTPVATPQWNENTGKFLRKAETLAREIGYQFLVDDHPDSQSLPKEFWIVFGDHEERIL